MNKKRLLGALSLDREFKFIDKKTLCGFNLKNYSKGPKFFFSEYTLQESKETLLKNKIIVLIDGEIDNFNELNYEFSLNAVSQKDLITMLYKKYPNSFETFLLGNFAISIYDTFQNRLTLVRDHFGTKPMYFNFDDKKIIFGSEIKLLFEIDQSIKIPNLEKILNYLCQSKPDHFQTFYKPISSLPPCSKLCFSQEGTSIKEYQHYRDYSFHGNNFKSAKKQFRRLLEKACSSKINRESKNGVQISGGLDSSVIYKIIQKTKIYNLESFSWNFTDENNLPIKCDETYFQDLISKNNGLHNKVFIKSTSPYSKIDNYLARFDQPFELANSYLYEKLYEQAKSNNIKYLFDGVDGDLVVSHGWERFKELFSLVSFPLLFYELFQFSRKHNYDQYSSVNLFKMFLVPLVKDNWALNQILKLKKIFEKNKKNITDKRQLVIKKESLRNIDIKEPYNFKNNYMPHAHKIKNKYIESAFINLDIIFFNYGITQVSPFFDKRVVDFCVSLPSNMKLNHGESRYILREAFKDIIPKEIYKRFSKSNLTHNFMKNISSDDLKNIENEILSIHPLISPHIDQIFLKKELIKLSNNTISEATSMNIWNFYLVNRWLKKNFAK